jgi:hypothetical protein
MDAVKRDDRMAADWVKVEHVTPDKPEIDQIARMLNLDHDCVFGKCVRLWIWADQQSLDGNALSVTESFLDRVVFCPGFANALRKVGWLTGREGHLSVPNFTRHNGQTAKNRAQTNARVKRNRNARSVTEALPEKRREEKSKKKTRQKKEGVNFDLLKYPDRLPRSEVEPILQEWVAYRSEKGDRIKTNLSLQAILNKFSSLGVESLREATQSSIASEYKGIFEPKGGRSSGSHSNPAMF